MPPQPKAKWTTDPKQVIVRSNVDGSFHAEVPLSDAGVKMMTVIFDVTPDRAVKIKVKGEPGAELAGFEAWSDF